MYKITIKGEAYTQYPHKDELGGIGDETQFSEYFDDGFLEGVVTGGYLAFKYENNKLYSTTTYESSRLLTSEELEQLEDYTTGQWSDGIGEGFEQYPCFKADEPYELDGRMTTEVYISPWFREQKTTITQQNVSGNIL